MKLVLATMMLLSALPVSAESIGDRSNRQAQNSQRGYASQNRRYRKENSAEYTPGTSKSPGYVPSSKQPVEVPCNREVYRRDDAPRRHNTDDNSCIEGSILGGIAGGGAGAALSRKEGRLWAIPLGIVGGALVGCQVDGG